MKAPRAAEYDDRRVGEGHDRSQDVADGGRERGSRAAGGGVGPGDRLEQAVAVDGRRARSAEPEAGEHLCEGYGAAVRPVVTRCASSPARPE